MCLGGCLCAREKWQAFSPVNFIDGINKNITGTPAMKPELLMAVGAVGWWAAKVVQDICLYWAIEHPGKADSGWLFYWSVFAAF